MNRAECVCQADLLDIGSVGVVEMLVSRIDGVSRAGLRAVMISPADDWMSRADWIYWADWMSRADWIYLIHN